MRKTPTFTKLFSIESSEDAISNSEKNLSMNLVLADFIETEISV